MERKQRLCGFAKLKLSWSPIQRLKTQPLQRVLLPILLTLNNIISCQERIHNTAKVSIQ